MTLDKIYISVRIITKGKGEAGGVEPTSHDLENGRHYNRQLWQAMQTIYEI